MNNYVLIVKKTNEKEPRIDVASDDLRLVSERLEKIQSKMEYCRIYTLGELQKMYINDTIQSTVDSMRRFKFYPIFRLRLELTNTDGLGLLVHSIGLGLDSNMSQAKDKMKESALEILNLTKLSEIINNGRKFTKDDIVIKSLKFIGMDTWMSDPMGNFHSQCGTKNDLYVFESFKDYMKRHRNSPKKADEDDPQDIDMSYSRYINCDISEYPVPDEFRNIDDSSELKIVRLKNLVAIRR